MAYRSLEKLINLYDGYRGVFRVGQRDLLLLQEGGELRLLDRYCPHAGQALDQAACIDNTLRCPRHGYCFSLQDGRVLEGACPALRLYPLAFEGNSVGVDEASNGR